MSKRFMLLALLLAAVVCASARADELTGMADVTAVDGEIISFRHEGVEYVVADGDVVLGTTTRWYVDGGVETEWIEGDAVPAAAPTVSGTSNAKVGDVGSKADNFNFTIGGSTNISSIDGIDFQQTIFPFLTNTFFHFERGGNDTGTWQAILADGSLGTPVQFSGATHYADTGVNVNGQNAFGVVFTTDVPVQGVRITASGHDTFSISALPVVPDTAHGPSPADGAMVDQTWITLGWSPGKSAVSHDVYLGDNFDDVNEGIGDTFRGNQADATLIAGFPGFPIPDGLVPGTTYYWRVDEVNDANDANATSPWRGDVWSFYIQPYTASNPDPADGTEFVDLSADLNWLPGYGAALHTVYIGTSFDDVNDAVGGTPRGTATYDPGQLEREKVYYWRVDEFNPPTTHKGDVWAFTTPGAVGNAQPANGAVGVSMVTTISWTPAENAASSDLYFGSDADAVEKATKASPEYLGNKSSGSESHDPGKLAFDATYYWRVDAVYAAETVKGLLWNFATADFIAVDDFESYNDIDPPDPASNRIFDKWIDGFGTTANGALVGNDMPPYAEQNIVHGGAQSMIYSYDNNLKTSEATLTLVYPRDWTEEGVTKLSLWFRGGSGNSAERMFVALNGNAVVYHDDAAATQKGGWHEWIIDLQAFAGVNLTNVNTITIGFGTKNSPAAGGTGTMHFDDIRLVK